MDTTDLRRLEPALRFAPPVLNLVLIVLIGIALAQLTWLLVPSPSGTAAQPRVEQQSAVRDSQRHGPDIALIQKSHLFGVATGNPEDSLPQSAVPYNAPETHLNLTLDGILSWNKPKLSRALIRGPDGKEHHYAIGDDLPGNAKLSAVYPDRVILKRSGGYETLRMKFKTVPTGQTGNGGAASLDAAVRNRNYGAVRTELLQHPNKITQIMRLQPAYQNHKMMGYRVYPGAKRSLFQHLGLRPGDLITEINGVKLNSQRNALSLLGKIRQARRLNVTLKRHGATRHITLSMQ